MKTKKVWIECVFNEDEIVECGELLNLDPNNQDDLIDILRELYLNQVENQFYDINFKDFELEELIEEHLKR